MGEGEIDNCAVPGALRHLYVHIPFCARICPYCAFYKERADPAQARRFCEAILAELDRQSAHFALEPETIFFGGGTPTALTTKQLDVLLGGCRTRLNMAALREWTLEANPGSVSERKAKLLRDFGVNRISLGVQSFDDGLLQLLGRDHSAAQAEGTFHLLRKVGFENLNIDLMFGLPGQTLTQWESTLRRAVALEPDHISAYCLTYEEDTDFFLRHARGEFRVDADADADFFALAGEMLGAAGLAHYEVSNYARAGFESVHNRAYWSGENYLGLGPSAVSTVGLRRWQNISDYRVYADRVLAGESASTGDEVLTPAMKRTEAIALSLRTSRGVPAEWVKDRPDEVKEFVRLGLMEPREQRYVLTRAGRFLADSVAEAFV
ncbi:MAG TPA: radical SAM family heme chaperone HemW [Chthoniobacteraceae bacterium]|nr:radical SAM family heme chaperone HemW [Chthoniobacteraceae bacterium]